MTRRPRPRCFTVEAIEETHDAIARTLRQFVGVLQELHGTNPDTRGLVVASFNNARIFHKWAVSP